MSFAGLTNDIVSLVKADGTVVKSDIRASVQRNKIFIFDVSLPIEVGDHILRTLPSGLVEDFIVEDPGYYSGATGLPGSYQCVVRRSGASASPAQSVINNITAHFHAANSRLNVHSTDNSVNEATTIDTMQLSGFVEQVKPHISTLPEPQKSEISNSIELLASEVRNGATDQSKIRSILQSLKTTAEGAAGNLVASGIVALATGLLS